MGSCLGRDTTESDEQDRVEKRGCCGLTTPNSYIGDNAFYDCEEGDASKDSLFVGRKAAVVLRKAKMVTQYSTYQVKRKVSCSGFRGKENDNEGTPLIKNKSSSRVEAHVDAQGNKVPFKGDWMGMTLAEWSGEGRPEKGGGPFWSPGSGRGLKVRDTPSTKSDTVFHLYDCISMDMVTADCKVEDILGRLIEVPEANEASTWKPGCPLPRVLCINVCLPYKAGPKLFGDHPRNDHGASFIGIFTIKAQTLEWLESKDAPACVRLFEKFCSGPCGKPGGPRDDPKRNLNYRRDPNIVPNKHAGLFKALAFCLNPDEVGAPKFMRPYNGKPALITKSGYVVKHPSGEWLEMGIDVRRFSPLARSMLVSFRRLLPKCSIHFGFLIQGVSEDELPEGLICDVVVHNVDMVDDPMLIEDPKYGTGIQQLHARDADDKRQCLC
eukprot:gnl/TRDRNA2_/TRDRNA2_196341_c0_seq1.p1 gnl/TRDRNA2_/TRDRNA2_196341_c0~~gnl/TRDRNA2_/TRDRNA2_196341_c0_seq1.p1  ORF type:complete len:438 (-),score=81.81 gnl/TRDRNA2_/TRDRNA2_196341_c0_seq1:116-1429(-)